MNGAFGNLTMCIIAHMRGHGWDSDAEFTLHVEAPPSLPGPGLGFVHILRRASIYLSAVEKWRERTKESHAGGGVLGLGFGGCIIAIRSSPLGLCIDGGDE